MTNRSTMLTAAMVIGVAAIAASTAARATTWVAVPDDDDGDYVAQTYVYDTYDPYPGSGWNRTVVERPAYIGPRDTIPGAGPGPVYVGSGVSDSCYIRREPGWFGGWHEERYCR